jgi:hypothetical protein
VQLHGGGVVDRQPASRWTSLDERRQEGLMRSDVPLLLILAVASCGSGCAHAPDALFDEAVPSFEREHSCPADRLQVKHAELPLPELVESKQPPAEVAADAGRLAVWNQTANQELALYEHLTAVDVAGCGSHAIYFCWYGHRIHRDHQCVPVDLDAPEPYFAPLTLKPSAGQWIRERLGLPPASLPPAAVAQPNDLQPAPTAAALQAQIQQMIEARRRDIESKLESQDDDNLKQLQQKLEQTRRAAAGQKR